MNVNFKEEAKKRMQLLNLVPSSINKMMEGEIIMSDTMALLRELPEDIKEEIKKFEEQYDSFVYHVIHTNSSIGDMYSFLYISKYEEEWEMDIENIENEESYAYVFNKTAPDCSEIGLIGVRSAIGGLIRTF